MKNGFFFVLIIGVLFTFLSCGGSDDSSNSSGSGSNLSGGCIWNGNCSSTAPNGAYDCQGNTLVQCNGGLWDTVASCGSFTNSKGYSCTCKGGCGTNTVECSYAFDVCGGQEYETCGPNAEATITDKWECM